MNILEICAGDIDSVVAAYKGGADRVELCSALPLGGLTPSIGLITEATKVGIKVNVLIRPREGDFVYSPHEIECMCRDIEAARVAGAHGVVFGALTPEGDVDLDACRHLMDATKGVSTTFHRAFDMCRDPFKALEEIIALGFDRILTSGLKQSALEGMDLLREVNEAAAGRIIIMPGAGVNPDNAARILSGVGAHEIHASARSKMPGAMVYRPDNVNMGSKGADEFSRMTTDQHIVYQIVNAINTDN